MSCLLSRLKYEYEDHIYNTPIEWKNIIKNVGGYPKVIKRRVTKLRCECGKVREL